LILMDIQMPETNGLQAIRHLRSNPATRNIPIIAISALAMPGDQEKCLEAGADSYLSKPIRFKNLENILFSLLSASQNRDG
jgi:CheY-like chemotaxis protein